MLARLAGVVVALVGVCACAAVTGLSDYTIDDAPGDDAGVGTSGASGSGSTSGPGPGTSSGDPPDPVPPAVAYRQASCRFLQRCVPAQFAAFYGSEAACEEARANARPLAETPDAQYAACAARLADAECRFTEDDLDECRLTGARPDGAACAVGEQCAGGRCTFAEGATCGTCTVRLAEGEACFSRDCQPGLVCAAFTCKRPIPEGAACTFGGCAHGLACMSGTCRKMVGRGETCSTTGLLGSSDCRDGTDCVDKTCVEDRYVALGEACGSRATCLGSSCVNDRCVAYGNVGANCGSDRPRCDPATAVCSSEKCRARPATPSCN